MDEDVERDIILTSARLDAQIALESIKLIRDERVLLQDLERAKREKGDHSSTLDKEPTKPVDWKSLTGPLMNSQGRVSVGKTNSSRRMRVDTSDKRQILRPFVITSKREEMRSGVFRPSWNLPTMTIEEYLDLEAERGNILEGTGYGCLFCFCPSGHYID